MLPQENFLPNISNLLQREVEASKRDLPVVLSFWQWLSALSAAHARNLLLSGRQLDHHRTEGPSLWVCSSFAWGSFGDPCHLQLSLLCSVTWLPLTLRWNMEGQL